MTLLFNILRVHSGHVTQAHGYVLIFMVPIISSFDAF